jgi:hypothetical protein
MLIRLIRGGKSNPSSRVMRVDRHRLLLDVPVDQDPAAAVPGVPLGEDVLVERPEMRRIRRDR